MIFIGYNHDSTVISIISCKTKETANAYWQGKGIYPHTIKEFDINEKRENEEQGYVTPILNTIEVDGYSLKDKKKVLIVTRNS